MEPGRVGGRGNEEWRRGSEERGRRSLVCLLPAFFVFYACVVLDTLNKIGRIIYLYTRMYISNQNIWLQDCSKTTKLTTAV